MRIVGEVDQETIRSIRAIIFDLHHTITKHKKHPYQLLREISIEFGIDVSNSSDEDIERAFKVSDQWVVKYQLEKNVDPRWGGSPEDWIQADKVFFEELGITDLDNNTLYEIEKEWKVRVRAPDFEIYTDDAIETLHELDARGYKLAVCTRRHDDPNEQIDDVGLGYLFGSVEWSGVPGYAKPSPYTLLLAASKLKLNPRLCAYVGNYVGVDVEAARRADMLPVLATWANPEEANKTSDGTIVINEISEILEVFTGAS